MYKLDEEVKLLAKALNPALTELGFNTKQSDSRAESPNHNVRVSPPQHYRRVYCEGRAVHFRTFSSILASTHWMSVALTEL